MGAPADSRPEPTPPPPASVAAPAGLEEGQRDVVAGRYRLLEFIAEGGMGSVYLGEHVLSKKRLALKLVHPHLSKGTHANERFRREVSAAAAIDHPGIVQIFDAGTDDDGAFFMAMELLRGESLGDRMRRAWPGMATSVGFIEGMLEPLAKAHQKGFVHRDLKPDNIFLAQDEDGRERVKLLDFGLARDTETKGGPTRTGITFGTPEYMSPEQATSARKVRAPGDVWSVGVMLYELLSGVHPFDGETPTAIMANAIKEPLPPLRPRAPHVPEPLARFVEGCLTKDPAERPQNAGEMLDALRAAIAGLTLDESVPLSTPRASGSDVDIAISSSYPVAARAPTGLSTELPRSSAPWIFFAVAVVVALGATGAVLLWALSAEPETERTAANGTESPEPAVVAQPEVAEGTEAAARGVADDPLEAEVEAPAVEAAVEAPTVEAAPVEASPRERTPAREATEAPRPTSPRGRAAPRRGAREEAGPSALEVARECIARGDRECARAVLAQRGRSRQELAMLIGIYRSQNQTREALEVMRTFVARYPNASQAAEYRALLERH